MTTVSNDSTRLAAPRADLAVRRGADGRVVAAALVVGLLLDLAVRSGVSGLAGALTVSAAAAGLVVTGRAATCKQRRSPRPPSSSGRSSPSARPSG